MQREDRLKSFPEGLKLPGDPFIQSPVNYQLQQKKPGWHTTFVHYRIQLNANLSRYPEVLLQVVDRDWNVFTAFLQLNVGESRKGEIQTQILHRAAVHVQAFQGLLQGLSCLHDRDRWTQMLCISQHLTQLRLNLHLTHNISATWGSGVN